MGRSKREASLLEHLISLIGELKHEITAIRSCIDGSSGYGQDQPVEFSSLPTYPPPPAPPLDETLQFCYSRDFLLGCRRESEYCDELCYLPQTLADGSSYLLSTAEGFKRRPFIRNQRHIAWSPSGLVFLEDRDLKEKEDLDDRSPSSLDAHHSAWRTRDLKIAIDTKVPADESDIEYPDLHELVVSTCKIQQSENDIIADSHYLQNNEYYDNLLASIRITDFDPAFTSFLQDTWHAEAVFAEQIISPDFIHQPYNELMKALRIASPIHNALPEHSADSLPLNRGQLRTEFLSLGNQIRNRHFGPIDLSTIRRSEKLLLFHRLCMLYLKKYAPVGGSQPITSSMRLEFERGLQLSGLMTDHCYAALINVSHVLEQHEGEILTMTLLNDILAILFAGINTNS